MENSLTVYVRISNCRVRFSPIRLAFPEKIACVIARSAKQFLKKGWENEISRTCLKSTTRQRLLCLKIVTFSSILLHENVMDLPLFWRSSTVFLCWTSAPSWATSATVWRLFTKKWRSRWVGSHSISIPANYSLMRKKTLLNKATLLKAVGIRPRSYILWCIYKAREIGVESVHRLFSAA